MNLASDFSFTPSQGAELLSCLPAAPLSVDLLTSLTGIARQYLTWKAQRENEPLTAAARTSARKAQEAAEALLAASSALDGQAEWLVTIAMERRNNPSSAEAVAEFRRRLIDFSASAAFAVKELDEAPDKIPVAELAWSISQLRDLFMAITKRQFTHTRGELGEPKSAGGRFIVAFFRAVDPRVTPSRISTELERLRDQGRAARPTRG